MILSSVYMLWMYQRAFLGKVNPHAGALSDLSPKEWAPIIPLIIMMVWLGCYTNPFLRPITAANQHLLEQSKMNLELKVQNHAPLSVVPATYTEASHGR